MSASASPPSTTLIIALSEASAKRLARNSPSAPAGARGGTLVLRDIAALDSRCQAILVRMLSQQPSIEFAPGRFRSSRRVRFVSTASENLAQLVRQGRFRADLYHRLAVATLEVPPLRARRADVPLLVAEALEQWAAATGRPATTLDTPALHLLTSYYWPGNVRELHNVLQQTLLAARLGSSISESDIRQLLCGAEAPPHIEIPVGSTMAQAEREIIIQTLASHAGNRQNTADTLGISRRTLYEKLSQYRRQGEKTPRSTTEEPPSHQSTQ